MTPAEVIERARSQIGLGTIYKLGKGGFMPKRPTAHDSSKLCDCSGFAAWCYGVSRKLADDPFYKHLNGGWFETSAIVRDCRSSLGHFDISPFARPAMLLVYGDRDGGQGHVGIISEVFYSDVTKVIHCSSGNYKTTGDAIQETDPDVFFRNGAIVARCAWVEA